jgi:PAS domain S-box-containing protein
MNRFRFSTPARSGPEEGVPQQSLMLELTPVLVCDPRGTITYWNRAAEVMYGFTREQAVGRPSEALLQTRFPEPLEGILVRLRSGRQWQGELTQTRSDGGQIAVASEWIAHLGSRGELESIIQVNTEVTERKRAEEALSRTMTRLDGIIESAMDAIISVDEQQRIVLFNPAAERMFGVSGNEALGQDLKRFIPERFRRAHGRHIEEFGKTGVTTRRMGALGSISGLRASGEEFPIEASISQVEVGGERLFTVILRDITRRVRAEESLRQAQAALAAHAENLEREVAERTAQLRESIAEMEAFSYSLPHDMRAPLRAISTFTSIFLEDYGKTLTPDGAELLGKILAASGRMDRLMQDLLAFSRVSRRDVQMQPVDVEKLILDLVMERPEFQSPKAEISVAGPLPWVIANPAGLTQCLVNLLSNAVKFVGPGVRPQVRVWAEVGGAAVERRSVGASECGAPDPEHAPHARRSTLHVPAVRLWVEDNGIGIESGALSKVFELFQRFHSQYEGTGLGLAIVRKAVERMDGAAGVESEPGRGSRFWIELAEAEMPRC